MENKTAVTSLSWVPRGAAAKHPKRHQLTEEDWLQIQEDLEPEPCQAGGSGGVSFEGLEEYKLDDYDEEPEGLNVFGVLDAQTDKALKKDKYLTGNESDNDDEYHELKSDDMVLACATVEDETCNLEVYVYVEDSCSLYVHHEVLLPAFPLATAWLPSCKGDKGNFLAVGSFLNSVDIWDLDLVDASTPALSLGHSTKKKAKKKGGASHSAAVLSLSANQIQTHVLASGSADTTVRLWDVNTGACLDTLTHHTDKVQCVAFHPVEPAILLTAGFDQRMALLDVRTSKKAKFTKLTADPEAASWSVQNPMHCFVTSEDGVVQCVDVRAPEKEVWTLQAHEAACTGAKDTVIPNMLVTASYDGSANVYDMSGSEPSLVHSRDLGAGPLFALETNKDRPSIVSFGGTQVVVWDLRETDVLRSVFGI